MKITGFYSSQHSSSEEAILQKEKYFSIKNYIVFKYLLLSASPIKLM